jgi:hypothetical protein
MIDKFGNELKVGDWILLFFEVSPTFFKIIKIIELYNDQNCHENDYLGTSDGYHWYANRVEKLPDDETERDAYIFLKKLEL